MIVYPSNQIEPQSESTLSVPVPVTKYPKPFQHTEYVFHGDPLSGYFSILPLVFS